MVWPFSRRPRPLWPPGSMPGDVRFGAPERDDGEARAITGVPWAQGGWAIDAPVDTERSLSLSAVYGSVRILADTIAGLPLDLYRRVGKRQEELPTPSLFTKPARHGTLFDWVHRAVTSMAIRGNAVGLITSRDYMGFPTTVEWLNPTDVQVVDTLLNGPGSYMQPIWYVAGKVVPEEDILHIPWFTIPFRVLALSPIGAFASTINVGLAGQSYALAWYDAGGVPPGVFKNSEQTLTKEQTDIITSRLTTRIRERKPLVYGSDWDYTPIAIAPNEARFIESARLTATQIATIYGVDPSMVGGEIGGTMTYCADTETELLTKRGWLGHREVRLGEECLTLNTATGLAEWQPVLAVNVFDGPHDVIELSNQSHSSVTTRDHRWPVIAGHDWNHGRLGHWWTRTTETLVSGDRVLAAAPVIDTPVEPKWSDAFVELMAWYWTEGYVNPFDGITITQSHKVNSDWVGRIRAALTAMLGPRCDEKHVKARAAWVEDIEERGVTRFRLNKRASEAFISIAPGKIVPTWFLAELTAAQLSLYIETAIVADGSVTNFGTPVLVQKDLRMVESFQVACALAGRSCVIRQNAAGRWSVAVQRTSWRKPAQWPSYISSKRIDTPVWCPTTQNGTWFARRAGTTYFTGNSNVESLGIKQLTYTFGPWLNRLEQALSACFPRGTFAKFNVDALLRTDATTRWGTVYRYAIETGVMTVNEIRALEDLPPLPKSELPKPPPPPSEQQQQPPPQDQQQDGQQPQKQQPADEKQPQNGQKPAAKQPVRQHYLPPDPWTHLRFPVENGWARPH